MKQLFYETIKEASNGAVLIDNYFWPISFNTIIYEKEKIKISYFNKNNIATLVIKEEEEFLKLLNIYIKKEIDLNRKSIRFINDTKENRIKFLISYLFANASIMDFENPNSYIERRIDFLNNKLFNEKIKIPLGKIFLPKIESDIILEAENITQDVRMETPYCVKLKLTDKSNSYTFKLPTISYGINEENGIRKCYIYSIQNKEEPPKDEKEELYRKKVSRMLYQLNKFVTDDDIKDVSVSFVLSLSIFINLLKKQNIEKINIILYLPLRYYSRELAASKIENEEKRNSLWERNEKIQTNLTQKFLTTIKRVAYQIEGIKIEDTPMIDIGIVEVSLNKEKNNSNNPLLNTITTVMTRK